MKSLMSRMLQEKPDTFNTALINSENDYDMVDLVVLTMKELEAIENIKLLGYTITTDQDEIDFNKHKVNVNYKKKDLSSIEIPKCKYISQNRYIEVDFEFDLRTNLNHCIIHKPILVPIPDRDGNFLLDNKKWRCGWQICEASTYSGYGRITLKSKMPTIIYKSGKREYIDTDGEIHHFENYSYALDTGKKRGATKRSTKFIPPMLFYAAKIGLDKAIDFFGYGGIISLERDYDEYDKFHTYFKIGEIYLKVPTDFMEEYDVVQSFVAMMCDTNNHDFPVTWENRNDKEYWICRIGYIGSIKNKNIMTFKEKGLTNLCMVERLLNQITINVLRLPDEMKYNIYYILKWMIENFDQLKAHSNMDYRHKRVRKNEMIVSATLGKKIGTSLNRFIEKKNRRRMNEMSTLLELFNFNSNIILTGMRTITDLVKSGDLVNDYTLLLDLMISNKGPNSLGESSPQSITDKYRVLDPSMVGILDINVSSNSDPGMNGALVPFVKIYDNFFFGPDPEPVDKSMEIIKITSEYRGEPVEFETRDDYLSWLKKHGQFNEDLSYEILEIIEKEDDEEEVVVEKEKEEPEVSSDDIEVKKID